MPFRPVARISYKGGLTVVTGGLIVSRQIFDWAGTKIGNILQGGADSGAEVKLPSQKMLMSKKKKKGRQLKTAQKHPIFEENTNHANSKLSKILHGGANWSFFGSRGG